MYRLTRWTGVFTADLRKRVINFSSRSLYADTIRCGRTLRRVCRVGHGILPADSTEKVVMQHKDTARALPYDRLSGAGTRVGIVAGSAEMQLSVFPIRQ